MTIEAINPDPLEDARFMELALSLGRRGLGRTAPNPAVGAVVVQFDENGPVVVGRGWTQPGGRPHAETEALARAGSRARGGTLYVTLEPCSHDGKTPPCTQAITAAGVATVVSAIEDPNPEVSGSGHAALRAAGLGVRVGILAGEAARAHAGHFRRIRDGRPHVTLKLAVSADGKVGRLLPARLSETDGEQIAMTRRSPVAITDERTRDRVHLMRAMNDAILIGIGTALADDPALTCRLPGMEGRSPLRVVLDRDLRLPPASRLVRTAGEVPVWVMASRSASPDRERALRGYGVEVIRADQREPLGLDLAGVFKILADRGLTRVMVEGGPTVAASLISADLVDEIALFRSPTVIGADGVDALEGLPLSALTQPRGLCATGSESIGSDTLETFVRR
jgi:diaminohydroxyphosphoribosylaminopyrimidine deaminase/5-amino-6-(5-phosphoribosylamino)uracil reductase